MSFKNIYDRLNFNFKNDENELLANLEKYISCKLQENLIVNPFLCTRFQYNNKAWEVMQRRWKG
jgi:hypothetical protein